MIFGLCYRMMSHRQDAEDVVQETFLLRPASIAGFDTSRPLRPWLLEIAANRCRTALSRRAGDRPIAPPESIEDRADPRPGLADPDDLAGELERAFASSGRSIAWSSSCSTSRICRTKRSPRRSHGRSAPSRPGCIGPGPNSPKGLSRRGVHC